MLVYFLVVWAKVGRDPEGGAIVPEYDPPDGFSPAAARYVAEMGYDAKVFTAAGSTGSVLPTGGAVYITLFSVPFFGGLFFDINGDYKLSFAFAGFMGVINLAILCLFYIRIKAQRNQRIPNLA